MQGGVVQGFDLALVLIHQGFDLLFRITGGLIGGGVEGLLGDLALVALVLIVVGLVVDVRLTEIVLVVLNGFQQLLVLVLLLLVDVDLALQAVGLHIEVGALDVSDQVALVDIAALGNGDLGDLARVAGHDVGLVAGLHHAGRLADVDALVLGAPHGQEYQQCSHEKDQSIAEGRQLFLHHDAAVLQVRKILDGRHSYLVSIKTSTMPSSSS